MAILESQKIALTGIKPTFVAATQAGDTIKNGGSSLLLIIENSDDAAAKTVTLSGVRTCSQGHIHDVTLTVPIAPSETARGRLVVNGLPSKKEGIPVVYGTGVADDLVVAVVSI